MSELPPERRLSVAAGNDNVIFISLPTEAVAAVVRW
jgi:hypothetical protein